MLAALYALSIAVLTIYGGNLLWLAVRHARGDVLRKGPVPAPDALPQEPDDWPAVTVQIPLYNEPLVVDRVIDACAQLQYPRGRLEIQVLDDSTDATIERAERRATYWRRRGVDIVHIQRDHREGFKAGALQNGLRLCRGDMIAIFDADFVPPPDFLLRVMPEFDAAEIGVVQARWGHLNQEASFLTRVQAVGLDAHFAVEQRVRHQEGCFINFNGTAGVWRRACIEDAGGWQGDTIAEDLDLSYRAQMKGWRFRYLPDVEVPAELPSGVHALRSQQFRWAKGSMETARKLLRPLFGSDVPLRVKLEGALHLTAHLAFPFILIAALVHAPLLLIANAGAGPGEAYFAWMSVGLVGFAGFALAQLLAQRELYPDWGRRALWFPAYMAGTMGLSLHNTRAVIEALAGRKSAFVRTPKLNQLGSGAEEPARPASHDAQERVPEATRRSAAAELQTESRGAPSPLLWLEVGMFIYTLAGFVLLAAAGEWAALPFQAMFAAGFGMIAFLQIPRRIQLRHRLGLPATSRLPRV